ncbi:VOC family protein [Mycetocola reblochoni]|uniref:Glyoxalase family protein n=2 Tax=Mycetocola reblochoni TaxID=331618 RepID=A0A1R4IJI5_9MICO|nr:VOC family protein [Mycetocola reblochoni]RLP67815.1 glyoxalase [Mycetocola reblochoni]SJN19931.1 Glyoxalase family protein [Mycetocola reblochoni REB411]
MTDVFVNLPTTDLRRSQDFYTALGFRVEPGFTDENASCIVVGEHVYLMILTREFLAGFTDKPIIDPRTHLQTMTALSRTSRDEVDAAMAAGLAAGGSEPRPPQDFGFMYGRDLEDPDGNVIEFVWMDPRAAEGSSTADAADAADAPAAE